MEMEAIENPEQIIQVVPQPAVVIYYFKGCRSKWPSNIR